MDECADKENVSDPVAATMEQKALREPGASQVFGWGWNYVTDPHEQGYLVRNGLHLVCDGAANLASEDGGAFVDGVGKVMKARIELQKD